MAYFAKAIMLWFGMLTSNLSLFLVRGTVS